MAAAGRVPSPYYQAARLAELAPRLSAAALADALDVAQKISEDDARARAMHGLAYRLPEDLMARVVSRIGPDSRGIGFTLAPLAPYLPGPLLQDAFTRAAGINSVAERAGILAALAHYLPEPLAAEALGIARQAARAGHYAPEDAGLARLAPHLPDEVAAEFSELPVEHGAIITSAFVGLSAAQHFLQAQRWAPSVASWEHVADLAGQAIAAAKSARSGRGYPSWDLRAQIGSLIGCSR